MVSLGDLLREDSQSRSRSRSRSNPRRPARPNVEEASSGAAEQAGGSSGSAALPGDGSAAVASDASAGVEQKLVPGQVLAESTPKLQAGEEVVLAGLKAKPELNGKVATVVSEAKGGDGTERCLVKVAGCDTQLSVKLENLERCSSSAGKDVLKAAAAVKPDAGAAKSENAAAASGSKPKLFEANLQRLKQRAAEEQTKPKPPAAKGGGKGKFAAQDGADAVLAEPVLFVPAEGGPSGPSLKVQVFDPRGHGMDDSESDDDVVPGQIRPPLRSDPLGASHYAPTPRHTSTLAAPAVSAPFSEASVADVRGPAPAADAHGPAAAAARAPPAVNVNGNFSLAVSNTAQKEERVAVENHRISSTVDEKKRFMLASLTQQLQTCIRRIQEPNLDDRVKEKYQDMIDALKAQMAKVTGISTQ